MGVASSHTELARIDGPTAWAPTDFPVDATWSFQLTERERGEIVAFADNPSAAGLSENFADSARAWLRLLVGGPGFVRLRGFPVEELEPDQVPRTFIELGRLLGEPVGQDRGKTNLIANIRDERLAAGPSVRRFQTNEAQTFHSDASDFVGLLCLRPAMAGGESKLVSAHTVINELLQRDAELTKELTTSLPWSRHTEVREGESNFFMLAPLDLSSGTPRLSLIPWFIRQSQVHSDAPRLTNEQLAALDLVEEVMADPRLALEMKFERGDIQFLNNTTVLHARNAFVDHDTPELRRHLLRLWLVADSPASDAVLHR